MQTTEMPVRRNLGRTLDAPLATFDLGSIAARLKAEDVWRKQDRNAIILYKVEGLRVGVVALHAGTKLEPHAADCPVTVQLLSGRIRFSVAAGSVVLGPGQLLTLQAGLKHEVEAVEEAAFLLTLGVFQAPASKRPALTKEEARRYDVSCSHYF